MKRRGFDTKTWRVLPAMLAALLVILHSAPADAQASRAANQAVFETLADEIVEGLKKTSGSVWSFISPAPKKKIAIWPFSRHRSPVSPAMADRLNNALLEALMRRIGEQYIFVERKDLGTVINEIEGYGGGTDNPVDLVVRSAKADILIEGYISLFGQKKVTLSYKALGVSEEAVSGILATTKTYGIAVEQAALSLDQGIFQAAKKFFGNAPKMAELRLGGIRFETGVIQTPFSHFVEKGTADKLADLLLNSLTQWRLRISRASFEEAQRAAMIGANAGPSSPRPGGSSQQPEIFVLTGTYWDLGQVVDLRLAVTDASGGRVPWRDLVKPPDGFAIRPRDDFPPILFERDGFGPIGFTLKSTRGADPTYRGGEKLNMTIEMDRDAWLYCFYRPTDLRWKKIFPNEYHPSARLAGRRRHTLPGDLFPFDLTMEGPAGVDLIKCFATTKNIAKKLPEELSRPDAPPLQPGRDIWLPTQFRKIKNAGLTEASLVITVTE